MPAPKYQKLQTEEEDVVEQDNQPEQSSSTSEEQPPSYEQSVETPETSQQAALDNSAADQVPYMIPPPYKAVEKLPTYEEMQEWKVHEARQELINIYFPPNEIPHFGIALLFDRDCPLLAVSCLFNSSRETNAPNIEGVAIGDDCTFVFAFVLSFFFNWIGLCIGLCVMQVVSSRYGSIAGFGASVIKWLLIVKFSSCCDNYSIDQQILAWWIPLFIGTLFIVKGCLGWMETRKLLKLTDEERSQLRFKYMGLF